MKPRIFAGLLIAGWSLATHAITEISPKVINKNAQWGFELRNKERRTIYVTLFGTDIIFQPISGPSGITQSSINALRTDSVNEKIHEGSPIYLEIGIARYGKAENINDASRQAAIRKDYNRKADELFVQRFAYKLEPTKNSTKTIFLSWEPEQYLKVQTGTGNGNTLKTQSGISFSRGNNLPQNKVNDINKTELSIIIERPSEEPPTPPKK